MQYYLLFFLMATIFGPTKAEEEKPEFYFRVVKEPNAGKCQEAVDILEDTLLKFMARKGLDLAITEDSKGRRELQELEEAESRLRHRQLPRGKANVCRNCRGEECQLAGCGTCKRCYGRRLSDEGDEDEVQAAQMDLADKVTVYVNKKLRRKGRVLDCDFSKLWTSVMPLY